MDGELVTGSLSGAATGGGESRSPVASRYGEKFEELCGYYMALGMSYHDYWDGDALMAKYYRDMDKIRRERENNTLWLQGLYFYEALLDASPVLNALSKKKKLTSSLKDLGTVNIPATVPKRLTAIGDALENISTDSISRVESLSRALQGMNGITVPSLSRLTNTPSAAEGQGDNGAITPGTEAARATEEISQAAAETGKWGAMLSEVGQQYKAAFSGVANVVSSAANGVRTLKEAISNLPINILRGLLTLPLNAFNAAMHTGAAAISRMTGAMKQLAGNLLAKIKNGFISIKCFCSATGPTGSLSWC